LYPGCSEYKIRGLATLRRRSDLPIDIIIIIIIIIMIMTRATTVTTAAKGRKILCNEGI
jgi:hypothetical protein